MLSLSLFRPQHSDGMKQRFSETRQDSIEKPTLQLKGVTEYILYFGKHSIVSFSAD